MKKNLQTPDQQREAQAKKDKEILIWASENKLGTQPPTIPEINLSPAKSKKNIKR